MCWVAMGVAGATNLLHPSLTTLLEEETMKSTKPFLSDVRRATQSLLGKSQS